MLFNSYPFFILLIITFSIYYLKLFRDYQILVLIVSSAVFYSYSQPWLLLLLFLSASINAISSYLIFHSDDLSTKKVTAVLGVVFNLLVLGFFKYNRLLDGLLNPELSAENQLIEFIVFLPLPVGISFYTFQGISLLMDVYKSSIKYNINFDKNFIEHYKKTVFYIVFFPQLVAGPIVKAHDFLPQIKPKFLNQVDFNYVARVLLTGFFLKSVIADNLKEQTFWIAYPYYESQSSLTLITMLFGYSMQIFADFAGYSLIAIGVAALFGYKLPKNFNFPYISESITEFWRRWHISLSSWLKEYLYFSLGGNRKGKVRTYINLIIVMFLGGMWHGAALSYGVWGLWHGLGLALERFFSNRKPANNDEVSIILRCIRVMAVFCFVSFGWLLFKLNEFHEAYGYFLSIFKNTDIVHSKGIIFSIILYSFPVVAYHFIYLLKRARPTYTESLISYKNIIYPSMLFFILSNGGIPGDFVYFQF